MIWQKVTAMPHSSEKLEKGRYGDTLQWCQKLILRQKTKEEEPYSRCSVFILLSAAFSLTLYLLLKIFNDYEPEIQLCLVDQHHATPWKMIRGCVQEQAVISVVAPCVLQSWRRWITCSSVAVMYDLCQPNCSWLLCNFCLMFNVKCDTDSSSSSN